MHLLFQSFTPYVKCLSMTLLMSINPFLGRPCRDWSVEIALGDWQNESVATATATCLARCIGFCTRFRGFLCNNGLLPSIPENGRDPKFALILVRSAVHDSTTKNLDNNILKVVTCETGKILPAGCPQSCPVDALSRPKKGGLGRPGRLLNSGWYCTPT